MTTLNRSQGFSRTLSLLAPPPGPALALDGEWRIAPAHAGDGLRSGCADPAFDDSAWEIVRLPHLRHSTAEQDTLWYRHRFNLQSPISASSRHAPLTLRRGAPTESPLTTYQLLHFGGAFYHTTVFLNGVELGRHEGYFQPFGFDVTQLLQPGDNVLAVRCRFPVEAGAFKRKTAVAGIFADWDCKPYPSTFYPHLPPPNEWSVPIGLWQPVSLHPAGPVLIESFSVYPELVNPRWPARPGDPGADSAQLRLVVRLRNLTIGQQTAEIKTEITPHNFDGETAASGAWPIALEASETRRFEFHLALPSPRLWFPWTHGEPALFRATVALTGEARLGFDLWDLGFTQTFGVRSIEAKIDSSRWEWRLNGKRIFPKGSNYISDFYLDRVTPDGLRRDVELARAANLDLLRVHAHIAPPDFYRLCDELGVMVMCDFPLIWTYAFNLAETEAEAFRASVHCQVEDMVNLLGSHPSISLWSMHNEPPWTPDGSFLGGDLHRAGANREMDAASAAHARELDPTRPVIAASGEYDQHLYHGWYTGSWRDNRDLRPAFPTEFGVQALPNLDSPFWATVNGDWPIDADDPSWAHAGYQSVFWASPGVGGPSHFDSLADYVEASQRYQAFYIRHTLDGWRRQKFDPLGGYIHFLFTDGWPAITWSVLDYFRNPKAGYFALAEASRPARICFDLEEGYEAERGFHLVYPIGATLAVKLYLVNDDYRLRGGVRLRWWVERREARRGRWISQAAQWIAGQRAVAALPEADEGSRLIRAVRIRLSRAGEFTFRARVTQGRRVLDDNWLDFRVGSARPHHASPRRVPGILIHRVYQTGSLRHTADGFTFGLRNPTMPVTLERLSELRVDGETIDASQVEIVCGGLARRASTITPHAPLEIPSGENFSLVVRGRALAAGEHDLEFTAAFFGLGEITARIQDRSL